MMGLESTSAFIHALQGQILRHIVRTLLSFVAGRSKLSLCEQGNRLSNVSLNHI